jgi:hypothetical protein
MRSESDVVEFHHSEVLRKGCIMSWRPNFDSSYSFPPALASLENSMGVLVRDGLEVGFISFRLTRYADRIGGHLWWGRYGEPFDTVQWLEVLDPAGSGERVDDGVERIPSSSIERAEQGEWATFIEGKNVVFGIRFLTGDEYERAWKLWGWSD